MKLKVQELRLDAGLQDSWQEDGAPFPFLQECKNARFNRGPLSRRLGYRRVARVTNENNCYDLDGSTQYGTVPYIAGLHELKRRWTLEALVRPDSFATNAKTILGVAHASDYSVKAYFTTAGKFEAKVQDSAGTVTTLTSATTFSTGTIYALQVVRDGTSLYMRVNGATEDSDTMADLDGKAPGGSLLIGADNGPGNYFDGAFEFVRLFNTARADQRFGRMRLVYPRSPDVVFDYVLEDHLPSASLIFDRSSMENHAAVAGAPSETTSIAVQTAPVFGIHAWTDSTGRSRMMVKAGREVYLRDMVP